MPSSFVKHCKNCPYNPANSQERDVPSPIAHSPLSLEANATSTLLIFQAPGADEWKACKPICSDNPWSAAARIRNALSRLGKEREEFSITNATQCYPGESKSGRDRPPTASARRHCASWLKEDIESSAFSKIIVFGRSAKQSVTELGCASDPRFLFLPHPSGGLSNADLDSALR